VPFYGSQLHSVVYMSLEFEHMADTAECGLVLGLEIDLVDITDRVCSRNCGLKVDQNC